MDVFDLDRSIIADYERFARSFTQIRSPDIKSKLDEIYAGGRFWPDPLITINPHFADGSTIDALAAQGTICRETAQVFRSNGQGLKLYRHQSEAVAKAKAAKSFVVTTGTGSGKSLCFFQASLVTIKLISRLPIPQRGHAPCCDFSAKNLAPADA